MVSEERLREVGLFIWSGDGFEQPGSIYKEVIGKMKPGFSVAHDWKVREKKT